MSVLKISSVSNCRFLSLLIFIFLFSSSLWSFSSPSFSNNASVFFLPLGIRQINFLLLGDKELSYYILQNWKHGAYERGKKPERSEHRISKEL